MKLKPYHFLDCEPELQATIAQRAVDYLRNQTDLYDDLPSRTLWNKLDTREVVRAVPELAKYFHSLGLKLKEVAVTVCNDNSGAGLHIDELPVVAKVNFPLLNTLGSRNLWYRVPNELMSTVKPTINEFGSSYYTLGSLDLDQCEKIADIELDRPVVFNSQIPHMVDTSGCKQFPRLVLTCMFFNEPVDLLKE
jgi:hypothetical protein